MTKLVADNKTNKSCKARFRRFLDNLVYSIVVILSFLLILGVLLSAIYIDVASYFDRFPHAHWRSFLSRP